MWLMASEMPVRLETLDQSGQCLSSTMARLNHLDETHALISIEEPASAARLHWGSPVRFELEDGMSRYEITGVIVARQEEDGEPRRDDSDNLESQTPRWEVRVRIWECHLNVQRRTLPRRRVRFRVRLRELQESPQDCLDARPPADPIPAWCVDIGAGGIRVRTHKLESVPPRMQIEFCLPMREDKMGPETSHGFCLRGRVIRASPYGRHSDDLDIAFRFECISVRDGMALRSLLS